MFDSVKEIVFNLGRRKMRHVNVFNPSRKSQSLASDKNLELFEAIKLEKVTSNKAAATFLGYENPEDKAYLMAMGRFRDSMLNLFFFLDEKHNFSNDYLKSQAKAIRFAMFGRLMVLVGLRQTGLKQLQKAILLCKQHQLTDLLEDTMLRYLVTAVRSGSGTYVNKYLQEYPEVKKQAETIKQAEFYACVVLNIGSGKKRIKKEGVASMAEAIDNLNTIDNTWSNLRLEEIKLVSNAFYLQVISDIVPLLDLCSNYEKYLLTCPYARNKHFMELYRIKLIALFYTGSYEEGRACFELGLKRANKNLSSYLNFLELYFLVCMRHKYYDKAELIKEEVSNHKSFNLLHTSNKERWTIYEPFLIFVLKVKFGNDYELISGKESHAAKIKRFLNRIPIATKDKMGLNAQVLIGQILLLLLDLNNENENAIIDRANSLKAYNYRHFKKPGNDFLKRTYYFIQFLIYVAEASFDVGKIKIKVKKTLEKLNKDSNVHIDITENFETIRYEDLMELVVEQLEKQH